MHEQFLLVIVQKSHFVVRLSVLPLEVLVDFRKNKVVPLKKRKFREKHTPLRKKISVKTACTTNLRMDQISFPLGNDPLVADAVLLDDTAHTPFVRGLF